MTDPTVLRATNSTMLMTPMMAAPPNTMPAVTGSLEPGPLIVVTLSLILPMTPAASSTPNSTPMTISQTKNSAIDRTQENFSTVHGLMCRSCSRARRGPRARARMPDLAGAPGFGAPAFGLPAFGAPAFGAAGALGFGGAGGT